MYQETPHLLSSFSKEINLRVYVWHPMSWIIRSQIPFLNLHSINRIHLQIISCSLTKLQLLGQLSLSLLGIPFPLPPFYPTTAHPSFKLQLKYHFLWVTFLDSSDRTDHFLLHAPLALGTLLCSQWVPLLHTVPCNAPRRKASWFFIFLVLFPALDFSNVNLLYLINICWFKKSGKNLLYICIFLNVVSGFKEYGCMKNLTQILKLSTSKIRELYFENHFGIVHWNLRHSA